MGSDWAGQGWAKWGNGEVGGTEEAFAGTCFVTDGAVAVAVVDGCRVLDTRGGPGPGVVPPAPALGGLALPHPQPVFSPNVRCAVSSESCHWLELCDWTRASRGDALWISFSVPHYDVLS